MNRKILSVALAMMLILVFIPTYINANPDFTLTTDKTVYNLDNSVIASGTATANYYVTFTIKNPSGKVVWTSMIKASSDGTYSGEILKFPSSFTSDFPAGDYLVIGTDGYTGDSANVTITLTQPGNLSGTVKDTLGAAVSGASVTLDTKSTTTDSTGAFSFTGLTPGNYTLTIVKTGFKNYTATVEIKAGVTTEISVTLEYLTGTVVGVVKDQSGAPIEGAAVTLDSLSTSTDASGKFTFTDVESGNYTLTVSKTGYSTYSESFTLAPGESKSFTITLSSKVLSFEKIVLPSITGVDTPTKIKVKVSSGLGAESDVTLTASVTLPNNTVSTTLVTFTESSTAGLYYGEFTPTVAGTYYMTLKAEKTGYTNVSSDEYVVQVLAKTDIAPLSKKIDDLSSKLTDVENSILSSISAVSTQLTNIGGSIDTLKDSVSKVLSSLTSVQSSLSSVVSKLDSLSTSLKSLSGKVDSVASAVSSGFSGLSTALNSLKSGVSDVGSSLSTMSTAVSKGLADMSSLVMVTAILVIITLIIAAVATFKVFKS